MNFIMEHEHMTYYEALKYLAAKYHIEFKERELTDKERETQSERESLLLINEFANKYFQQNLFNTEEGVNVWLSYVNERGFNESIINKFNLGYSLENSSSLFTTIKQQGFNLAHLIDTGLCINDNRGGGYDRFRGRVMFPVHNIAGKIVAFGGRTLKNDHAKYVNSPESLIYKKSNELYGLYKAKTAIVNNNKCFLVEVSTDVI